MDQYIPVDVYVPGCGCRPEQIIAGVVEALAKLEQNEEILKIDSGWIEVRRLITVQVDEARNSRRNSPRKVFG